MGRREGGTEGFDEPGSGVVFRDGVVDVECGCGVFMDGGRILGGCRVQMEMGVCIGGVERQNRMLRPRVIAFPCR